MTIERDHTWTPPPVVAPNIYPVDWRVEDRRALNVYERAKDLTWNPTRLSWDTIDADALDPEERLAVAYHGALGAMFEYAAAPQFLHPLSTLYERHEEHGLILLCMATGRDEFVHEEFFRRVAGAMIPGFPFEFTPRTELEHRAVQNLRWVEWKQSRMWPTYTEKVVLGDNPWLLQVSILAPEIVGMVLFDRIIDGIEWPALKEGYRHVDVDERRHVAYGRLLFEKRMRDRDRPTLGTDERRFLAKLASDGILYAMGMLALPQLVTSDESNFWMRPAGQAPAHFAETHSRLLGRAMRVMTGEDADAMWEAARPAVKKVKWVLEQNGIDDFDDHLPVFEAFRIGARERSLEEDYTTDLLAR